MLREGEMESCAVARFRLHPDPTCVTLDNFLADGKADARPGILLPGVQALKDDEDALGKLRRDADAMVAHREVPARRFACEPG